MLLGSLFCCHALWQLCALIGLLLMTHEKQIYKHSCRSQHISVLTTCTEAAHLCFDKFAPMNLYSLKLSRVFIAFLRGSTSTNSYVMLFSFEIKYLFLKWHWIVRVCMKFFKLCETLSVFNFIIMPQNM